MKTNTNLIFSIFTILWSALAPESARAAGIELYELGTPDLGLASAGYAARAADAATVFKNPAGISRLEGSQFEGGLQAMYGSMSFTPNANTSARLGTEDGGNAVGWLPGGSLFLTHQLNEKWAIGLGALSYFGAASRFDDD